MKAAMDVSRSLTLAVAVERWPIAGRFAISRGAKTEAVVVVVELADGAHRGRGECVPYARYGESIDNVVVAIEEMRARLSAGLTRTALQQTMPAGAARNALDCAFWDLTAKRSGRPVHEIAGLPAPRPLITAYTISLASADEMAQAAAKVAGRALLKIKLGAEGDEERIAAVRAAAPRSTLIVDANEGWDESNLPTNIMACAKARVELIEQPVPEGRDDALAAVQRPIRICADESAHGRASLPDLVGRYDAVNIKLDKAGGLTEALAMIEDARRLGLTVMLGSMVGTSLGAAPAVLAAQEARYVDLDGPLLLTKDREPGLIYEESQVWPPEPALWG
jgi:L-alanine-DL-glutamate epimerase-like enolase superfamily enzyme